MTARRLIAPALVAIVFAGAWYSMHSREEAAADSPRSQPAPATNVSPGVPPQEKAAPTAVAATPVATSVEQMIADANGADAARRAAAISALARAPRAQAVPALYRVLINGEPSVDRPLALKSLQELALAQGDADGAVRAAIREVIYHGNDETLMAAAQDSLDVVEESELR